MLLEAFRDRPLDLLRGVKVVIPQRDRVVLAQEEREDVDVILPALRSVDQEPRPRPLSQRVVDILGVVREHAEGAVAAHDGIGPGEGLHQHCRDLLLARARLPVAALARDLVDVVHRTETDDGGVHDVLDKGLGVLTRLALIAVHVVDRQVLVAERIFRHLAVVVQKPRHHLDQRRLARPRLAVAHEGEDEAAHFGKGIQPLLEVIGHQHLGQPHRLVLGDVVAHHLVRFLEGHDKRRPARLARRLEPRDREIVGLHAVVRPGKGRKPRRPLGPRPDLVHQLFGIAKDRRDQKRLVRGVNPDLLVQLPQRAVQREGRVVAQHLLDRADLHCLLARLRGQEKGHRIAEGV